jgi:hypothetical protein
VPDESEIEKAIAESKRLEDEKNRKQKTQEEEEEEMIRLAMAASM